MKKLNLQTLGIKSKKLIRDQAGVKTTKQLIKLAIESGIDVGKRKETQEKRTYKYFGEIYNELVKIYVKPNVKPNNVIVDITHKPLGDDYDEAKIVFNQIISKLNPLIDKEVCYIQLSYHLYTFKSIKVSHLARIKGKTAHSIFWETIMKNLTEEGSDDNLLYENDVRKFHEFRLVITTDEILPSIQLKQSFLDGKVHCVIEPLYNLWFKMSENSVSKSSKQRCLQIANKIRKFEEIYPNGVPEKNMEDIAKVASRCIVLHDIIGNVICKYNSSSSKMFHFTNTRKNHIDTGFITINEKYTNVSTDELNNIIQNTEWGLFGGDFRSPSSFSNTEGSYSVYNKEYELFKDFNNSLNIQNYSINAVKLPSLNQFILESRVINSAPIALCNDPNKPNVKHADVEKAYTQHSKCPYYIGFLGKIHQYCKGNFDRNFIKSHVGIYKMKVLECENNLFLKLGIKVGLNYTLTSPEALKMMDSGIKFKIFAGCWGSTFKFEYTPEILANRNYCIWAGKLGMENEYNTYSFKGNAEWASHLKYELGNDNVFYFKQMNMILIRVKKLSYNTTHHILSFITSYTRINMIEMMEKVDGELVKVILDGIYYTGTLGEVSVPYKNKDIKTHMGFGEGWYFPSVVNIDNWGDYDSRFDGNCVLAGAGGCGKSYSVFNYTGFTEVLYVVPSHMLGGDNNYCTIHRLVGIECQNYRELYKVPSVIFIDELTMIEEEWILKAIKLYPESQIIIGGDIDKKQWYQCRNGYVGNFSKIWLGDNWRFVNYENDYRALDDELKTLKQDIRNEMKRIFTGEDIDTTYMRMFIKKRCKTISFDEAVSMTLENDIWIAGTHKTEKMLKDKGVMCFYKGDTQPSFTIHSFQGQTIDDNRVFIRLDLFEYAMLYTAISRVRHMSQIVLVL